MLFIIIASGLTQVRHILKALCLSKNKYSDIRRLTSIPNGSLKSSPTGSQALACLETLEQDDTGTMRNLKVSHRPIAAIVCCDGTNINVSLTDV